MNKRQKAFVVLIAMGAILIGGPALAHAADAATPITSDSNSLAQVELTPVIWSLLTSLVIPYITGFLTTLETTRLAKSLITLFLSAVTAVVGSVAFVGGNYVFTKETVLSVLGAWAIANLSYDKLFKPAGLTSSSVELPDPNQPGKLLHMPGKLSSVGRQ